MASTPPDLGLVPSQLRDRSTEGKIFVGGLGNEITEMDLKAYFSRYGELTDVVIMRDKITRNGRGFGFVTFQDKNVSVHVASQKHEIKGKSVEAKIAVPPGAPGGTVGGGGGGGEYGWGSGAIGPSSEGGTRDGQHVCKIFVGGLPPFLDDAGLSGYFSCYGTVKDATVMMDHATQRSRGFGFVTFDSPGPVDQIMLKKDHTIQGKLVELRRAFPRGVPTGSGNERGMAGGPIRERLRDMGQVGPPGFDFAGGRAGGPVGGMNGGGQMGGMNSMFDPQMFQMFQMMMMAMNMSGSNMGGMSGGMGGANVADSWSSGGAGVANAWGAQLDPAQMFQMNQQVQQVNSYGGGQPAGYGSYDTAPIVPSMYGQMPDGGLGAGGRGVGREPVRFHPYGR